MGGETPLPAAFVGFGKKKIDDSLLKGFVERF